MDLDLTYGMLVNKTAPYCAADYEAFDFVEVVSIRNRPVQIERQTYEHFQQLRAYMENEGVRIGIIQGRRSEAEQAAIYREFIEKFGKERADQLVAPVGTSEHHTGLALDVEVYGEGRWLNNHADRELAEPLLRHVHPWLAEYGFLLRYPEGKEAITTIGYEPWHIRYVGRELAKHLAERQWTLEEFYMEERGYNMAEMEIIKLETDQGPVFEAVMEWNYHWWGQGDGHTYDEVRSTLAHSVNAQRLPQTFVAMLDGEPVGMYQLSMSDDLKGRPDIYPWLINVYVDARFRGRGISRVLMESVPEKARQAGLKELYLYTSHVGLYEKFGWELVELVPTFKADSPLERLYRLALT